MKVAVLGSERKNENMVDNIRNMIKKFVSISDLSRGKASQVVQNVVKNEDQCIIVKNNKPEAVILSLNEYLTLIDIKEKMNELEEDIELIQMVRKRIENTTKINNAMSHEDILKRYDITEEEINELMNIVEIE